MAGRFHTISFLSDLGVVDEHVGVVHAVLRDLAPHVAVVDLTHHVPAYDVRAGSLALARAIGYVPSGVVLAAVDARPFDRPMVAIEVANGEGVLVGPDNGLLAPAVAMAGGAERAVLLTDADYHLSSPGGSFPVRDVLAPVAAHLCNGVDLAELGEPVEADVLLPGVVPLPRDAEGGGVQAEVLWIDQFGNCQLNVSTDDLATAWGAVPERVRVRFSDEVRSLVIATSFGDLGPGAPGLVVDASGLLCVALDRASAADELELSEGASVHVSRGGDDAPTVPVRLRAWSGPIPVRGLG